MRTIRFRGRRLDNGKWVCGDLMHYCGATLILPLDMNWFDFVPKKDNPMRLPSGKYEVDSDTVGQFTGLQDAEGVDIYEGDLLLSQECGEVFEVIYDAPHFVLNDNDLGYRFLNHPGNFMVIDTTHDIEKGGEQ